MPIFEFPYRSIPIPPSDPFPNGHLALRPMMVAGIRVPGSSKRLRVMVLVDSGADHCVFPATFAGVLGIDLLKLKRQMTAGVGSSANPTYYTDLEVDLGSGLRFGSYVGFTPAMDAQGIGLLGQHGFFDYYNVHFKKIEFKFTIETT